MGNDSILVLGYSIIYGSQVVFSNVVVLMHPYLREIVTRARLEEISRHYLEKEVQPAYMYSPSYLYSSGLRL